MKTYEECYYIVLPDYDFEDSLIYPTEGTAGRKYKNKKLLFGEKPLIFDLKSNKFKDQDQCHLYFNTPTFIANNELFKKINFGLYGCQFYPAIVRNEIGEVKDNYWALNTYKKLDCWDRKKSTHSGENFIAGLLLPATVEKYALSKNVLDNIPQSERLIFRMGNTDTGLIFVHESIIDIFKEHNVENVKFYKVSEYELGDEF